MTADGRERPDVLDERARALARPVEEGAKKAGRELLVMSVGAAEVAVDVGQIREVLAPGPLARLPGDTRLGLGLRNVGGQLLVVVDLGALLSLQPAAAVEDRWVVVVEDGGAPLGVLVDRADSLVGADTVEPPSSGDERPGAGMVAGITAEGACVLEVDALFAETELLAPPDRTADRAEDQEGSR